MKKLLALALCVLLLAGCTAPVVETTSPPEPEYIGNSPVPNIRTGISSQSMSTLGNGMEVTESGVYFMCYPKGLTYLLYADHDSDTFVKHCARPDCTHSDRFCNAYFENGTNVYYDGTHLYVGEVSGTYMRTFIVLTQTAATGQSSWIPPLSGRASTRAAVCSPSPTVAASSRLVKWTAARSTRPAFTTNSMAPWNSRNGLQVG